MAIGLDARRVSDRVFVPADDQGVVVLVLQTLQRHEAELGAEPPRLDRQPLGLTRGVVGVDGVDLANLAALGVVGSSADEIGNSRVYVSHGSSVEISATFRGTVARLLPRASGVIITRFPRSVIASLDPCHPFG